MRNHNDDTIKTSDTVLKKNILLTIFERVVCERELETEQNCNILTPTPMAITVFLSRSPGLLNRGPVGPSLSGTCSHSSIFSPTRVISNCNCSIGGLRAHSAGCWLSLRHHVSNWSDLQLPDFLSSPGLYNNLTITLIPASVRISHSFNPSTVKVIIF